MKCEEPWVLAVSGRTPRLEAPESTVGQVRNSVEYRWSLSQGYQKGYRSNSQGDRAKG